MPLIYTFRSNPDAAQLVDECNAFVFGKLKEDLVMFEKRIVVEKPTLILGLAVIKHEPSKQESVTVNQFNQTGTVLKNGVTSYPLTTFPDFWGVTNTTPTTSFCNWTMYRLASLPNHSFALGFIHYNHSDKDTLLSFIHSINS
jgi:hypothetical protein